MLNLIFRLNNNKKPYLMENKNGIGKEENARLAIGFVYNMVLLLVFVILILIIREWYIMPMLFLWDRSYLHKPSKNKL